MCGWPPTAKSFLREELGRLQSCVRAFGAASLAGDSGVTTVSLNRQRQDASTLLRLARFAPPQQLR
jgi:hypothetical protein